MTPPKISLTSVDDLFSTEESRADEQRKIATTFIRTMLKTTF